MVICSAYGCKSRSDRKEPGITFHRFPADLTRSNLWVEQMNIDNWLPTPNTRLCSKHFETSSFYHIGNQNRLLDDAVPTIFPKLLKCLQPKKNTKKSVKQSLPSSPVQSEAEPANSKEQKKEDSTPTKRLERQLFNEVAISRQKSKKIKLLEQELKRYRRKVMSMKKLIRYLHNKNVLLSQKS